MFYFEGLLWFFNSKIGHLSLDIKNPLRYTPFNNIGSKSNKIMSPARRASLINHCTQQQSATTVLSEKSSHFNTNHPLPSAKYSIPKWNHKRSRQPLGIDKSNQKSSSIWLENGNSLAQPSTPSPGDHQSNERGCCCCDNNILLGNIHIIRTRTICELENGEAISSGSRAKEKKAGP